MATLIRMSSKTGATCSKCGGHIAKGAYCYAENGLRRHSECPVVASAPVAAAPASALLSPEARAYVEAHVWDHYSEPSRRSRAEIQADAEYDREG